LKLKTCKVQFDIKHHSVLRRESRNQRRWELDVDGVEEGWRIGGVFPSPAD